MEEREEGADRAELKVTEVEARQVANLLRYVISLNTNAGLISPTERRLTTPTYLAVELAARILEGQTFEDAAEASERAWTGSLERDHERALELVRSHREALQNAMSGLIGPERFARYLEIPEEQFLQLITPNTLAQPDQWKNLKK